MASRQKAGGNFDRMNQELSKTRTNFGVRSDRQEISRLMRGGGDMERKPSQWEVQLTENAATKRAIDERLREFEDEQTVFHGKPAKR